MAQLFLIGFARPTAESLLAREPPGRPRDVRASGPMACDIDLNEVPTNAELTTPTDVACRLEFDINRFIKIVRSAL